MSSYAPWLSLLPLLYGSSARAEIVLDRTQAVATQRRDAGTGACGSFIQYKRTAAPVSTRQQAEALLDKPAGDAALRGRVTTRIESPNLRNGKDGLAEGDFTGPTFPDHYFPYSQSTKASPAGDDIDLAARLRGYLNVTPDLVGRTLSFALSCDDFCSLRIGQQDIVPSLDITQSQRSVRQVRFTDTGLYPIELVHFQSDGAAFLEWALSESAQPECSTLCTTPLTDSTTYGGTFKVIPTSRLYSAQVGESACQECGGSAAGCSTGSYCGNGLCQACNVADHCGASCSPCPSDRRICSSGTCVQCASDDQCPVGRICHSGACQPPRPCTSDAHCESGMLCDSVAQLCVRSPAPCTDDASCSSDRLCDPIKHVCVLREKEPCLADSQCASGQVCDRVLKSCQPAPAAPDPEPEVKPAPSAGCSASASIRDPGSIAGLWALSFLIFCALQQLVRRARRQTPRTE